MNETNYIMSYLFSFSIHTEVKATIDYHELCRCPKNSQKFHVICYFIT